MKKFLVFVSFLVLMTTVTDTSPILSEKEAKQLLRTRRESRPRKAGFPDEPMRGVLYTSQKESTWPCTTLDEHAVCQEYMLYLQRLEQRSEEQFLEHWLNPHCLPHCNRDLVHPV